MALVTVHRFTVWSPAEGDNILSTYYATAQAIEKFGGALVEGTAIEIEEPMLDGDGRYKPKGG